RLCVRWQRMRRTSFENAIAVTVGIPIFIANACGAETPWAPPPSTALFSAVHRTAWSPTPPTGTWATLPLYQCDRASSVEHEIPSTPDGRAVAVAVTYWVPAVEGASLGPESETVGCWLSTSIVRRTPAISPAASHAPIRSVFAP